MLFGIEYIKRKHMKFSQILKELRIEKKLSQNELAKQTGYSQPAIARWEANLQIPNIEVAITFAKFFGVSTDYLLGLED